MGFAVVAVTMVKEVVAAAEVVVVAAAVSGVAIVAVAEYHSLSLLPPLDE